MDFLRWIDARLGRWLAYADSCVNAETELPRCQGFWSFVAFVLAVVGVAALAAVIVKLLVDRRKGPGKYSRLQPTPSQALAPVDRARSSSTIRHPTAAP